MTTAIAERVAAGAALLTLAEETRILPEPPGTVYYRDAVRQLTAVVANLEAEVARLRGEVEARRVTGATVQEYINLRRAVLRYEDELERCRAEHVDRIDRLTAECEALRYGERTPF